MKRFIFLATVIAAAFSLKAVTVNVTSPGSLAAMSVNVADTDLTVTGTIDVRDIDFINESFTRLSRLDLSQAAIAAYKGKRRLTAQQSFPANELPPLSLAGSTASTVLLPASLTSIGDGALAGSAITALDIPAGVVSIGDGALAGCEKLAELTVPAAATAGNSLARACTSLKKVTFNAPAVPDYAFAECTRLQSVTLADNVTAIGDGAFADCTSLKTLAYTGSSLREIGSHALRNTGLASLDLHSAPLETVGPYAFSDNAALESLALPKGLSNVAEGTFLNSTALTELKGLDSYTTAETAAFSGTSALYRDNLPGSEVRTIGLYAMRDMTAMTTVTLPATLQSIETRAFDGCTGLKYIDAKELRSVPALGDDVWGDLDKSAITLNVDADMVPAFEEAPQWRDFNLSYSGISTSSPDNLIDPAAMRLSATSEGETLIVTADMPMGRVRVFDTMGRLVADTDAGSATSVAIAIGSSAPRVLLITAAAADNSAVATIKTIH